MNYRHYLSSQQYGVIWFWGLFASLFLVSSDLEVGTLLKLRLASPIVIGTLRIFVELLKVLGYTLFIKVALPCRSTL